MTDADAARYLESYFNTSWTATEKFFNMVPDKPTVGVEFASFWVIPSTTYQTGLGGSPEYRAGSIIQVDINVPARTGTRRAIELGDQVSGLFLGKQIDGITVRDKTVAAFEIESFYRRVVSFNCYYNYTTS